MCVQLARIALSIKRLNKRNSSSDEQKEISKEIKLIEASLGVIKQRCYESRKLLGEAPEPSFSYRKGRREEMKAKVLANVYKQMGITIQASNKYRAS